MVKKHVLSSTRSRRKNQSLSKDNRRQPTKPDVQDDSKLPPLPTGEFNKSIDYSDSKRNFGLKIRFYGEDA